MLVHDLVSKTIAGVLVRMGNSVRDIDVKVGGRRDPGLYDAFLTDEETSLALSYPTDLRSPSEKQFDMIARHGFEVTDATLQMYAPQIGPVRASVSSDKGSI
jgi:NTE family protein